MTVEHKVVLGLGDVRAIVCECAHCGARLSMAPESVAPQKLANCPACGMWWMRTDTTQGNDYLTPELALVAALKTVRDPKSGNPPNGVRILFEFDAPRA